ncbi:MAG: hypothetical protein HKN14_09295 [Marinicaulis sp.]|nr:hypothetical protein [Marinicaulis sp.]NNL88346.1 hypothetical protein [Marinicaulis sp.]
MANAEATLADEKSFSFWNDVSAETMGALSPAQRENIETAVKASAAASDHADIKLSLGGYYIRVLAGSERRNPDRVKSERAESPIFVKKNIPVLIVSGVLSLIAAFYAVALLMKFFGPLFD